MSSSDQNWVKAVFMIEQKCRQVPSLLAAASLDGACDSAVGSVHAFYKELPGKQHYARAKRLT